MAKVIASGIFLVKKDKKLLICHPTKHALDFWSIPKGKVESGESLFDAAIRETYEETNLYLKDWPHMKIHELEAVNYSHKKKMLHPFLFVETDDSRVDWETIEIKCNSKVNPDRGDFFEMDDYKWVTIDEARKLLHATQVACLDRIEQLI